MSRKAMRNYLKAVSQRVDRKKMYKAKKQWIVAGMSFLVAMGIGTAVNVNSHASTVDSANAPVTKVASQKPQMIQHQAKQLHNQVLANASLNNDKMIHNTNSKITHNINNGSSASAKSSSVAKPASAQSSLDSQNQASSVESNVASSASQSSKSMRGGVDSVSNVVKSSSNATKVNPVVSASAKGSVSSTGVSASNSTSNQVAKSAVSSVGNSKSVASNIKKPVSASKAKLNSVASASNKGSVSSVSSSKVTKGFGATRQNKPLMLDASNGTAKATDNNWIFNNGKYLSDGQVNDWATYTSNVNSNLTFKYSPSTQAIEYVSGTIPNKYHFTSGINWTGTKYVNGHKESQSTASIPQPVSLKIDNGIDTSKVTDMSGMFDSDTTLRSLNLGNHFDTSNVTNMRDMFYGDSNLQSLDLGNEFDTSKVTDMSYMFYGDEALHSLDLVNNFDTSHVTNMGGMFWDDKSLQSLDLSNFDTSKVTNMRDMFYGDSNLQSLDLGNEFDTSKVTDMANMFHGDSNLQSLNLGNNFNTSHVTNMTGMFWDDKSLQSLDLSNFNTSNVTDMLKMFKSDESLRSLDLSNFNTSRVTNMCMIFENDTNLQSLNLGNNFDTNLQSLGLGNNFDTSKPFTDRIVHRGHTLYVIFKIYGGRTVKINFRHLEHSMLNAFLGDRNLNKIIIGSPSTVFSKLSNAPTLYKETGNVDASGKPYTLATPNDFSKGNVGTFTIDKNVRRIPKRFERSYDGLNYIFNPKLKELEFISGTTNSDLSHFMSDAPGNIRQARSIMFDAPIQIDSDVSDMSDMFSGDKNIQSVINESPSVQLSDVGLPNMYQETGQNDPNGKPYTLATPNDFSKGNIGTFITPANPKPVQKVSYSDIYGSSDGLSSNVPKATTTPKSTDLGNDWAYVNAQGIESKTPIKNAQGHVMIAPAYRGLVYHLNNSNSNLEFTSGTADNDMQYFWRDFPHKVRFGTTFDPNVDMSHVTNMSHMFDGIGSDGLDLGNHFDTHNVTDMSYMFNGLSENTMTIPKNFDTSNVTNMSHMFAGHSGNVVLPDTFVTPKVTDMSDMFVQNGVKLPDSFDPSNVTNMSGMFASDNVSDTLDKNFDTHNVTNMSGMFSGAYANSITLPSKFNTSKVTNMSSMFSRCGFNSIDLGSNFYTNNVTNMGGMFHSDNPVTLNLGPHFNTASVNRDSNGASPFSSDQGIQNIIAPNTCVIPSKYAGLASQDGYNWYVKGNPQPNETLFDNNSNRPAYATYTLQPIPKVNTTINYINQNGTNVGTQKDQSAKGTNISLNIPNGYHLTNNTPVTANGGTQNVNVTGNQVNIQGTLHLTYNSKRGSNLINTNKVDKPITISGNVGNTVQAADPFDYIEVGYGLPSTLTPWSVAITNNMGKQSDSFTYNGQIAGQLTVIYTDITPGHVKSDVGHQVLGDLGNEGQVVELAPNTNHDTKFDSSTGNRIYDVLQTPTGFTLKNDLNYITLQLHKNPMKLTLSLSEPVIHHHVTPKVVKPTNHNKKNQPNKPVTPVINHKKVTPVKPHTDTHKVIRPKHDNKNQAHKVVTPKKPNKVINNHKVVKPTQPVVNHKSNNKKPVTPIKPKNHVVPAKPKTNNTHKSVSPVKPTDSKAKGKVINHNNKPVQPKVVKPVNHKSNTNKQTKPTKVISHKNKPVAPINHKSDSTKPVAKKNNKQVVPNKVNKNQPKAHESVMPLKPNVPTVINTYNYQSDNNDNSVKALIAKLEVKPEVKNDDATVSFKPKQFINHQVTNLNKIKVGHIANYRGMRVERVRGLKHYHFNRYVRIYTNIKLGHKAYAKSVKASKIKVIRAYKIHGRHGKYIRYEVRIGKRNYFVSGRALKHHVIRKHLRKLIRHFKHLR